MSVRHKKKKSAPNQDPRSFFGGTRASPLASPVLVLVVLVLTWTGEAGRMRVLEKQRGHGQPRQRRSVRHVSLFRQRLGLRFSRPPLGQRRSRAAAHGRSGLHAGAGSSRGTPNLAWGGRGAAQAADSMEFDLVDDLPPPGQHEDEDMVLGLDHDTALSLAAAVLVCQVVVPASASLVVTVLAVALACLDRALRGVPLPLPPAQTPLPTAHALMPAQHNTLPTARELATTHPRRHRSLVGHIGALQARLPSTKLRVSRVL